MPLSQVEELGRHDGRGEEAQAQEASDSDEGYVLEESRETGLAARLSSRTYIPAGCPFSLAAFGSADRGRT